MDLAARDDRVVVILGDISHYLFNAFQEKYPSRFYNMGVCENALVSIAAGLGAQGLHPFVHTVAPFFSGRRLGQIKLAMCFHEFCGETMSCGGALDSSPAGATHHCYT